MNRAYPQPSCWWQRDWSLFCHKQNIEDFAGGPVVKTSPSIAESRGLIPSQGAKISYVLQLKNQNIKQKQIETDHWKRS